MAITQKELAEIAGVHRSTIDKVIHNRPGVSEAKRQQILKLLKEHGYEANPIGKALNYQKLNLKIAVVLLKVDAAPWIKYGMETVQQDFNSFHIQVEYFEISSLDASEQANFLRKLCGEKVSGIVLLPVDGAEVSEAAHELYEAGIPIVTVNSDIIDTQARLCFVGQNMVQAGQMAARLFSLFLPNGGKIGIISSDQLTAIKEREQAFIQHLPAIGGIYIAQVVEIQHNSQSAYAQTAKLLRENPDINGLFITCGNAADICNAVRDAGLTGKLTIISYERYPEIQERIKSGEITCTIGSELREQGQLAMRLLFEYIVYSRKPEQSIYYTKNEIMIKENV